MQFSTFLKDDEEAEESCRAKEHEAVLEILRNLFSLLADCGLDMVLAATATATSPLLESHHPAPHNTLFANMHGQKIANCLAPIRQITVFLLEHY